MSANTQADGAGNAFNPDVVESEADLAETLRMPFARDADKVMEILEATNAVALKLESSWWGNEAIDVWSEWFFVHPDGVSPSGKALFFEKGIAMSDPVGKLRRAESRAEGRNGWTSKAVRRARQKALSNWEDDYMVGPGGGKGFDERDVFTGLACPLSVIEKAVRLPEPENDLVFPAVGDSRSGKMSEGDIRITGRKQTKYGPKVVLKGDTYKALSGDGDNISDKVWDEAHPAFDGDVWTADPEGSNLRTLISALNDHGYSVAVSEELKGGLEADSDMADAFDV